MEDSQISTFEQIRDSIHLKPHKLTISLQHAKPAMFQLPLRNPGGAGEEYNHWLRAKSTIP